MAYFSFHVAFWTSGTSCAKKMTVWSLPEFPMLWTYNAHFCRCVLVFNFGIIILVFVDKFCLLNEFLVSQALTTSTNGASIPSVMYYGSLPILTMFRAFYFDKIL